MQLLIGMSISRYIPATETAGVLRCLVSGYRPGPRPPPRMKPSTSFIALPSSPPALARRDVLVVSHTQRQASRGFPPGKTKCNKQTVCSADPGPNTNEAAPQTDKMYSDWRMERKTARFTQEKAGSGRGNEREA